MLWIRIRLDPELFPGFGIICFGSGSRQKGKKKKQKNNKILHLFRFHCTDNTGTVECSIKVIPVADFLNSYFGFSFTFSEMFKIIPARTLNSYKVGAGSRINHSGFTTLQLTNHLYNTFFYLLSCKKNPPPSFTEKALLRLYTDLSWSGGGWRCCRPPCRGRWRGRWCSGSPWSTGTRSADNNCFTIYQPWQDMHF